MAKAKQFWFRHDVGSLGDLRMQRILRRFGMEGIGLYWCLVEIMYAEENIILFENIEDISFSLRVDADLILKIANDKEIFESNEEGFWSNRILSELSERKELSEKYRQNAQARWDSPQQRAAKKRQTPPLKQVQNNLEAMEDLNAVTGVSKSSSKREKKPLHKEDNAIALQSQSNAYAQYNTIQYNTDNTKEENISAASFDAPPPSGDEKTDDVEIFIHLPCVKKKPDDSGQYRITKTDVDQWQVLYQGIDVAGEIRKMKAWLDANPSRKKVNVRSFVVNWLGRAQDSSRATSSVAGPPPIPNGVSRTNENFSGRSTGKIDL